MKLTNRLALPEPIVEAIANNGYDPGESDITATGLIEPARLGALKKHHAAEMSEDASDLIYSLQGQSIHTILERAAIRLKELGYVAEQRFYHTFNGWKVGAQIDVYNPKTAIIQDYKVTSVYSVKDGAKAEYERQMNVQAAIMRRNGFDVRGLQIVAILRDWSKGERQREEARCRELGIKCSYPEHQVAILDVSLIEDELVVGWIHDRIDEHRAARKAVSTPNQVGLPLCTNEERWARPDKFAVMEKGKQRATKLFDSIEAAEQFAEEKGPKFSIEYRPGEAIRCANYCPVSKFCKQFNRQPG